MQIVEASEASSEYVDNPLLMSHPPQYEIQDDIYQLIDS